MSCSAGARRSTRPVTAATQTWHVTLSSRSPTRSRCACTPRFRGHATSVAIATSPLPTPSWTSPASADSHAPPWLDRACAPTRWTVRRRANGRPTTVPPRRTGAPCWAAREVAGGGSATPSGSPCHSHTTWTPARPCGGLAATARRSTACCATTHSARISRNRWCGHRRRGRNAANAWTKCGRRAASAAPRRSWPPRPSTPAAKTWS